MGPDVCSYFGVYCAASPAALDLKVIAGVNLNHADLAGYLPSALGLLSDLALLYLNSNRFCGTVPRAFRCLRLLHELDLRNNRFFGVFPDAVLHLPTLRFLDLRFNEFEGPISPALFQRLLDAIFLNSNRLRAGIPTTLRELPAFVVVLANNAARLLLHQHPQQLLPAKGKVRALNLPHAQNLPISTSSSPVTDEPGQRMQWR